MMMPARVAIALQEAGWWLRSEIIWAKRNPMPESVRDRPTSAHEKMFLMALSKRYFYDADAVRTPRSPNTNPGRKDGLQSRGKGFDPMDRRATWRNDYEADKRRAKEARAGCASPVIDGANLRNVWPLITEPFPEAHFATFPPSLVEPCVKAGTSEHGCCAACGAPWRRLVERPMPPDDLRRHDTKMSKLENHHHPGSGSGQSYQDWRSRNPATTVGWEPTCECAADVVPCRILDPFGGAGTVGLVANRLGRDATIVEINGEYADMARHRIYRDGDPLFRQFNEVSVG